MCSWQIPFLCKGIDCRLRSLGLSSPGDIRFVNDSWLFWYFLMPEIWAFLSKERCRTANRIRLLGVAFRWRSQGPGHFLQKQPMHLARWCRWQCPGTGSRWNFQRWQTKECLDRWYSNRWTFSDILRIWPKLCSSWTSLSTSLEPRSQKAKPLSTAASERWSKVSTPCQSHRCCLRHWSLHCRSPCLARILSQQVASDRESIVNRQL